MVEEMLFRARRAPGALMRLMQWLEIRAWRTVTEWEARRRAVPAPMNSYAGESIEQGIPSLTSALDQAAAEARARGFPRMAKLLQEFRVDVERPRDDVRHGGTVTTTQQAMSALETWRILRAW